MVLVAGATGSLGGRIVQELLERGQTVRALVRPSADPSALRQAGVEIAVGDLKDPASLANACRGVDAVISTATATKRGDDSIEDVDLRGNRNLIDAAEAAGVGHFIFVSTIGASPDSPVPVFRAKGAAEQRLRDSRMTHTILQPNAFMDVWFPMMIEMPLLSGRPVTLVGESRRRHTFVAERDVAAFAVAALTNPAARNATILIGGPEPLSLRDVVRIYEEIAGRAIPVESVAPGEPIPGLPEPVWAIAASLETFDSMVPMEATAHTFGVTLTHARWLARSRVSAIAHG